MRADDDGSENRRPGSVAATGRAAEVAVCVLGALFSLLLMLVVLGWDPLQSLDEAVVAALNAEVSAKPWAAMALMRITDLGGSAAGWLLLSVALGWLLIRRERALAVYVAVSGLGAMALTTGVKALVGRDRPVLDAPVAAAPGLSFPSGHSLTATVTYGVLLLVFLPAVPSRFHRAAVIAVATLVVTVGITRIALGVHYPSDVLGGWLLGVLWLLITAMAFRRWHENAGLGRPPLIEGLEPEEHENLAPASAHGPALPAGWHTISRLLVAAVLIWGALVGVGMLIVVGKLPTLRQWDFQVAQWFASIRTEWLTDVLVCTSRFGDTGTVVGVLVIAVAAVLALTRRWRPALFLVVVSTGQSLLFLASSAAVGRVRPDVEQLTTGLSSPTSSFPSGHVGAATATYGAVALVLVALHREWWRYLAIVAAGLIALSVAVARLYLGVHFLTDTLASVLYASTWLAVCWYVIPPQRPPPQHSLSRAGLSSTHTCLPEQLADDTPSRSPR